MCTGWQFYRFALFQDHQRTYHRMCYCANLIWGNRPICGLWASFFTQCCTDSFLSAIPVSLSYSAEFKLPIIIYHRKFKYSYLCQIQVNVPYGFLLDLLVQGLSPLCNLAWYFLYHLVIYLTLFDESYLGSHSKLIMSPVGFIYVYYIYLLFVY